MNDVGRALVSMREKAIEDLCKAGFELRDECTLCGEIDVGGVPIDHTILIPLGFPIEMPKVSTPGGEGGLSWHRDTNGQFCLWAADGAGDLPWKEAWAILDRVKEWHRQSQAGWPSDSPDLDLERYWPQFPGLVLYPDLKPLDRRECKVIRHEQGNPVLWRLEPGRPSVKNKPSRRSALVLSLGELDHPLHNLSEIQDLLSDQEALLLEGRLAKGDLRVLVLAYTRQDHEGALVLFATSVNPIELSAAQAAHDGVGTRRMRAGFDAAALSTKSVAIVGVGSIGSHLAEELAKSGIGSLTLVDADLLRPGNCIRHVLGHESVGIPKAKGMRSYLHQRSLLDQSKVNALDKRLITSSDVEDLFDRHDLVIDATGNGPATSLICMASDVLGRDALTACIQRGGTVLRVDRLPLRPGESHAAVVAPGGPAVLAREGGCGDPVSPTPPWVCAAAAAHTAGMAADVLSGRMVYPPTLIQYVVVEAESDATVTSAT
ncbi:MAG: HesA/MoeB/ThiF family protein [Hyphomicrobiales bacterium]